MCKFRRKWLKKKLIKEDYAVKRAEIRHIDPKTTAAGIWGKVIYALRRRDLTALYTACGDVRNYTLEGDELVIYIEDEYLFNIIASEKNVEVLQTIVCEIDDVATIRIEKEIKEDITQKDIANLKRKFGNILQIK